MKSNAYVFDLDGTITNTRQRDHLNPRLTEGYNGSDDRWVPFSMAAGDDEPNWPVIWMMSAPSARFCRERAIGWNASPPGRRPWPKPTGGRWI